MLHERIRAVTGVIILSELNGDDVIIILDFSKKYRVKSACPKTSFCFKMNFKIK